MMHKGLGLKQRLRSIGQQTVQKSARRGKVAALSVLNGDDSAEGALRLDGPVQAHAAWHSMPAQHR